MLPSVLKRLFRQLFQCVTCGRFSWQCGTTCEPFKSHKLPECCWPCKFLCDRILPNAALNAMTYWISAVAVRLLPYCLLFPILISSPLLRAFNQFKSLYKGMIFFFLLFYLNWMPTSRLTNTSQRSIKERRSVSVDCNVTCQFYR